MNYEDELERVRAKRSRRQGTHKAAAAGPRDSKADNRFISLAEPGSRASRAAGAGNGGSHGNGGNYGSGGNHGSYRRRKNGRKKWSTKKKIIVGVIAGLVILILAAVIGVYAYIQYNLGQMNSHEFRTSEVENPNISLEMKERMEQGYWTLAVFGLDSRDSSTGKGNRADVIMIVNLDRATGEIKLASVYRDTYMDIGDGTFNKINEAYAKGGPELAVKALNKNLDLNITNYAAFNWAAVATAINILGGVDIDISRAEFYYINAFITETVQGTGIGSTQLKSAGLNHLDGVQAVAYGRLRLMDSDYARVERQRLVIEKAFEKAKSADLATLESLVAHMVQMCATNVEFGDIFPLAQNVTKYHLGDSLGFPSARGEERIRIGRNNLSCIVPQTLTSNVSNLHSFLFGEEDYEPSSTVQSISAHISEVSGMYHEGTEATRAATDNGYIPSTTAAAAETPEELEQSSEGESTSEGESASDGETLEGESESGEESSTLYPGQSLPGAAADESGTNGYPGTSAGSGQSTNGTSPTSSTDRPRSPADITPTTEAPYGPGYESSGSVQEATTAASPETSPTAPSTSIIVVEPSTTAGQTTDGPASETTAVSGTTAAAPSSPADETLAAGSTNGPAAASGL